MRISALVALPFLIAVACVGDDSTQPATDSGPDQTTTNDASQPDVGTSDAGGSDGDAAAIDLTWTVPLSARSSLNAVATDVSGNVYVAGQLEAPLTLGGVVNIASTQGLDVLVIKFDATTKLPVWGVTYGGAGDDVVLGMAVSSNGIFITGTTTGTAMKFGGTNVGIVGGTSTGSTHSFFARLDPSDGSTGWAISPDQFRSNSQSHYSECGTIAVSGADFSIGCVYDGSLFGWDQSYTAYATTTQNAFAVFRFKDMLYGPVTQWSKSLVLSAGTAFVPSVSLDTAGDTWLGGSFRGVGTTLVDQPSNITIFTGTSNATPFVLKIPTGTQTIAPSKAWTADVAGLIPSVVFNVVTNGTNVYAAGMFAGSANFGSGTETSSGSLDMFAVGLSSTTLSTTWFYGNGGAVLDSVRGFAADGANAFYLGMTWGSTGVTFNGKALPDPAASGFNGALGKLDSTGKPVSFLATTSANAAIHFNDVEIGSVANAIYAVGTYGGSATFDDGTMATGNATDGDGFLIRRAKF